MKFLKNLNRPCIIKITYGDYTYELTNDLKIRYYDDNHNIDVTEQGVITTMSEKELENYIGTVIMPNKSKDIQKEFFDNINHYRVNRKLPTEEELKEQNVSGDIKAQTSNFTQEDAILMFNYIKSLIPKGLLSGTDNEREDIINYIEEVEGQTINEDMKAQTSDFTQGEARLMFNYIKSLIPFGLLDETGDEKEDIINYIKG